MKKDTIIQFLRKKDFKFIEKIGYGSFGETVLLEDEYIGHKFVCKKYEPFSGIKREDYYKNFVNEIKLLHLIYDVNIVRVFNYYLYPEKYLGYIMMEYIDGLDIGCYLEKYPENINIIFEQTIKGFTYLEENNILHRDIREANILVTSDHTVKIIDFGFGKQIEFKEDNAKDISINWWGDEKPNEFKDKIYDNKTEIFFIGKLFAGILERIETSFKYKSILKMMINNDYHNRIDSFQEIYKNINNDMSNLNLFNSEEKEIYQKFRSILFQSLSKRKYDTELIMDNEEIIKRLELLKRKSMLEDYISGKHILRVFLKGSWLYNKPENMYGTMYGTFSTELLSEFLSFFKHLSQEKKNIVMYNIETSFDDVEIEEIDPDEIPF